MVSRTIIAGLGNELLVDVARIVTEEIPGRPEHSSSARWRRAKLELTPDLDGVPTACVANFDNLHTLSKDSFRRRITQLGPTRMAQACRNLRDATTC